MIREIELHNVRNFPHELIAFDKGITVLTGSNGSGKSTILNAISYVLTDKHTARMRNFGNTKTPKKKSWIRLAVGDLEIKKWIIPKGKGKTTKLEITDKGKEVRLNTQTAMKDYILERLGIEPYLFLNGIFVGQGTDIDLLIRPSSAKGFLMSLFNLAHYSDLEKKAKQMVSETTGEVRANDAQILGLSKSIQNVDEAEIEKLGTEVEILQTNLDAEKEKLVQARGIINELKEAHDEAASIEAQRKLLHNEVGRSETELATIPEDIEPDSIEAYRFELEWVNEQIQENRRLARKLRELLGFHKGAHDGIQSAGSKCPVCETALTDEIKSEKLEEKRGKIETLQDKLEGCEDLHKNWLDEKDSVTSSIRQAERKQEILKELQEKKGELKELTDPDDCTDKQQFMQVQEVYDTQVQIVTDLTAELKRKEAQHEELVKRKFHYDQLAENIAALHDENARHTSKLEHLKVLAEAYGKDGIPKRVIEASMERLEDDVNANLELLTDGEMFLEFVTYRDGKEVFEVYVYHDGFYKPYQELSGGESKRVLVAAMLGLSDFIGTEIPFRLGDEIDVFLDTEGVAALKNLLKVKCGRYEQIILASHDMHLIDIADKVIRIGE